MPIKIKTDLEFGSVWYIKNDPDQFPHHLVGIVLQPGNVFRFRLSYLGDIAELYDFECSQEPNTGFLKDE
jgi:hypothetical protein